MSEFYWMIPGWLAGRRKAGLLANLEGLWDAGLRTIVSLTRIDGAPIRAAGFHHYSVPMTRVAFFDWLRLRLVREMLSVVDLVATELAAGRPTLVHCRAGKDRTGAVLAGYLIRYHGLSSEEAFRRVRQVNPRAMTMLGFDRLPMLYEARLKSEG